MQFGRDAQNPLVRTFRNGKTAFHPFRFVRIAELSHVLRKIRVIIICAVGAALGKTVGQHAFPVRIVEAPRTVNPFQTAFPAAAFHRFQQGVEHFEVVDGVEPRKADIFLVPHAVVLVVHHGRNAPDELSLLIREETPHVAVGQVEVLFRVENIFLLAVKRGNVIRAVFI